MTQQNQLGTVLGNYLDKEMMPSIVDLQKNVPTTPYVNAFSETPDNGLCFDSPRYSTGYTSL
jgi:hypothetical protein